jgi:hypothetical protein
MVWLAHTGFRAGSEASAIIAARMAAPYRVVSPLPTDAGLEKFLAEDGSGLPAWVHQAEDRAPEADDRMLAAAALCTRAIADLVQVLDAGRDATTRAWVATGPIEGSTLAQLIATGPLETALAIRLCARLAEVLEAVAPLGLFPALPPDAIWIWGTHVQLLAISPLPAPKPGREQVRAVAALLDRALPIEGRRADVAAVIARGSTEGAEAFARPGELAAALHVLVGGDTRPSNRAGVGSTMKQPSRDGEVLGSYELVSRLGEGGMGDVYLARHTRLGREVALKLLKAELASDADVVRRFFQEARVVNEINHPHIVEVIDFVEEPPHVFCVMEHLKGSTLGDLALAAPLSLKRIASMLQQTCEALHAAHTHGVVHRDVKPANIFVSERNGQPDFVKLLDFGIARLMRTPPANRTEVGMVIGTPAYMSPEQAQGRTVDARTDIYAVGAVLFELLSGQTLSSTISPKLPELALLGEPIPRALSELVSRCIAMEPTMRPASALEIVAVLKAINEPPRPDTTQRAIAAAGLGVAAPSGGKKKWAAGAVAVGVLGIAAFFLFPSSTEPPPVLPIAAVIDARPIVDAGVVAAVEPVVADAGVQLAEVKADPPPKKKGGRPPAGGPLVKRFTALKKNYASLVGRYGAEQLTKLERARVGQSMEDYAANDLKALASSLPEAEQALRVASQRLGP